MKDLKRRNKLLLLWLAGMLFSVQAFAQSITVNGVVKDNLGEPVIGASVLIKGTTPVRLPTSTVISLCKPTRETSSLSPLSDTKRRNFLLLPT